jgi:hypothetical protein
MKTQALATPYFSAYPLKALNLTATDDRINEQVKPAKRFTSLRVLPMANPYTDKERIAAHPLKKHNDIQADDEKWFCNYE